MREKCAVYGLLFARRVWYDIGKERVMHMYGYYQPTYYDMLRQQMQQQAIPQPAQTQSNILPAQQVIQVAGRQSIDTLQMSPNSSVLIMDTSAPIVWLCVSDGLGKVTATAYDITIHQDTPPFDIAGFAESVEERLKELENKVLKEADKHEPDAASARNGEKSNGWTGKH